MRVAAPPATRVGLRPRLHHGVEWSTHDGLPEWRPAPPLGGWVPASAMAAAEAYAREVRGLPVDRVTKAAYFELRRAVPGLHGLDLVERLRAARGTDADLNLTGAAEAPF